MACCGSESRTWNVEIGGRLPPERPPTFLECIFIRIYGGVLFPRLELGELFPRLSCLMEVIYGA